MKRLIVVLFILILLLPQSMSKVDAIYREDYLPRDATTVIKAEYTGSYINYGVGSYLEFTPTEVIYGEVIDNTILLSIASRYFNNIEFGENNVTFFCGPGKVSYEKGKEYLIVARREVSVYYPQDIYTLIDGAYLPMEDFTKVEFYLDDEKVRTEIVFDRFDPNDSANNIRSTTEDMFSKFVQYVISEIEANPEHEEIYGYDFIREENFEEIKENSDIIVRVRTVKETGGSKDFNSDEYKCRVLETVKGSINEKEVKIRFLYNTVKTGGEYIVCLSSDKEGNTYILSAKNAVQTAQEEFSVIPIVKISVSVVLTVIISLIIILIKKRHMAKSS